jgi:hypothetical protein
VFVNRQMFSAGALPKNRRHFGGTLHKRLLFSWSFTNARAIGMRRAFSKSEHWWETTAGVQ